MLKRVALVAAVLALLPAVSRGQSMVGSFQANTWISGRQLSRSVASDANGNFVVVWTGYDYRDGSYAGVFAQRYDAWARPIGTEFQVNTYTTSYQHLASVASDPGG